MKKIDNEIVQRPKIVYSNLVYAKGFYSGEAKKVFYESYRRKDSRRARAALWGKRLNFNLQPTLYAVEYATWLKAGGWEQGE